jgi:hypothetical protein
VQHHPAVALQRAEQPGGTSLLRRPAPPGDGVRAGSEPQPPAGRHGRQPAEDLNLPRFPGCFLFAWVAVGRGHAQPCLIVHRAQVADRGVPPGPVVDGLQPPEHLQAGLLLVCQWHRSISSHSKVAKKLSIRAWSKQSPTDPIDARIPKAWSLLPNARLVNWSPGPNDGSVHHRRAGRDPRARRADRGALTPTCASPSLRQRVISAWASQQVEHHKTDSHQGKKENQIPENFHR